MFADAAVFEDNDLIRMGHGGQTRGDHDGGLSLGGLLQVLDDSPLRRDIDRTEAIVQDQNTPLVN